MSVLPQHKTDTIFRVENKDRYDDEKITVENSNLAHGMGVLDLQKFEIVPKNPAISKGV